MDTTIDVNKRIIDTVQNHSAAELTDLKQSSIEAVCDNASLLIQS